MLKTGIPQGAIVKLSVLYGYNMLKIDSQRIVVDPIIITYFILCQIYVYLGSC